MEVPRRIFIRMDVFLLRMPSKDSESSGLVDVQRGTVVLVGMVTRHCGPEMTRVLNWGDRVNIALEAHLHGR